MAGNGDSLRRVQAGDRAQIPADAYNAFLDVVRERRAAAFDGGAPAVRIPSHPPATVLVRNDTGGDLDRFAVVVPGAPAVAHADDATEFFRRPNLAGDAPEGGEAVFAVLLEPAADGDFAPAQVSGVCPVRINVTSEAHTHASPVAGDTEMLGSDTAGVPVLWKESGTGTKWAYVLLGAASAPTSADVIVVRPTSTGTESSTAYVQQWSGGDWADTATTVTAVISSGGGGATTPVFDSTSIRYLAVRLGSDYYIPAAYASATSSGWVNTTTQTLAGNKTLNGYLTVDHRIGTHARLDDDCDIVVGATAGTAAANSGVEAKSDATNGDTAYFKVETDAPAGNALLSGAVLRHGSVYGYTDLYTQSSAGGVNLAILAGWNDLGGGTITFDSPKYAVLDEDQTLHVGVYGTLADGSVVKGGVVTSAGSTIDGGTW